MTSSPFESQPVSQAESNLPVDPPAGGPVESTLLDTVLEQTLARFRSSNPLSVEELQTLRLLVARFGRQEFQVEPIGVELVKALLGHSFEVVMTSPAEWQEMTTRIAHALAGDPIAHERLRGLWSRLAEVAS